MFIGVDHIGVAVKNLEDAITVYCDFLGFELKGVHVLKERKVKVAFLSSGGETNIELLEPLSVDSPIAKFLERRGEGVHHFAVKVTDIETIMERLRNRGVLLVDEKPRESAEGSKIAFIHPKSTKGVLLELVMK